MQQSPGIATTIVRPADAVAPLWCNGLGLAPLRAGLKGPEDLVGDPAYPTSEEDFARLLSIPMPILVEHQKDWFARFNEIMQS